MFQLLVVVFTLKIDSPAGQALFPVQVERMVMLRDGSQDHLQALALLRLVV